MCTSRPEQRGHPLNCILPPYMLENIAQNGSPDQQALAQNTLAVTSMLRQDRAAMQIAIAKGEVASGDVSMAPGAAAVRQRFTYTADFSSGLPGRIIRTENDPPCGDAAIDEAHDGAGATYDLYLRAFQRNSIDNLGMPLRSTVHYQVGYDNAFWNGSQMVYGDGDENIPLAQRLFNRFTIAIDVIGHELTHGVTQHEANLIYSGQPGALNESISDVFGSLVKQYHLNQDARSADWIIGQGLFTSNVNGVGIRSMKAPGSAYNDPVLGKDPQPAHMSAYVNTTQDNGGVHINSGIPNRAFYITAYELGGNAWVKAGQIWYAALADLLSSASTFQNAADIIYGVAGEKFGVNSLEQKAVLKGWTEVGITPASSTTETPVPNTNPGCVPSLLGLLRPRSR